MGTGTTLMWFRNPPRPLNFILVMRGLNRHHVRVFNTSREETHWGKRKLARDL